MRIDRDLGLAEAIAAVRDDLLAAQQQGDSHEVRFEAAEVEVEFAVAVRRDAGGRAEITVLKVFSAGGQAGVAREDTHRVKVKLKPVGRNGGPIQIARPLPPGPSAE